MKRWKGCTLSFHIEQFICIIKQKGFIYILNDLNIYNKTVEGLCPYTE